MFKLKPWVLVRAALLLAAIFPKRRTPNHFTPTPHFCEPICKTAACAVESGRLTLVSDAGEGEVVSKEVGEEERGAQG